MNYELLIRAGLVGLATLLTHAAAAQTPGGPAADVGAGKKRAAACFACHGADGVSRIPGTPHLAGQQRAYLERALRAYREGQQRQDPTMTAMARPLSDADIANIAAYFSLQVRLASGQTAAQAVEAHERLRPVGMVEMVAAATPSALAAPRTGDAVYGEACTACHGTGAAGAPRLGDKGAWEGRIAQGKETLYQHALQGFKGMPARGACAGCSDAEVKAAVDHLVARAR